MLVTPVNQEPALSRKPLPTTLDDDQRDPVWVSSASPRLPLRLGGPGTLNSKRSLQRESGDPTKLNLQAVFPLKTGEPVAASETIDTLATKKCKPCEGGVDVLDAEVAQSWCDSMPEWSLTDDGKMIRRKMNTGNFRKALKHLQTVGELAEQEGHHPDLHLTGYRHLTIELTTHAIGGLSENDFILAAKIDQALA